MIKIRVLNYFNVLQPHYELARGKGGVYVYSRLGQETFTCSEIVFLFDIIQPFL